MPYPHFGRLRTEEELRKLKIKKKQKLRKEKIKRLYGRNKKN